MTDERQLPDDVEGHEFKGSAAQQQQTRGGRWGGLLPAGASDDTDVAGHRFGHVLLPTGEPEDADVEGHARTGQVAEGIAPAEDVDGHFTKVRLTASVTRSGDPSDDDPEGHLVRAKYSAREVSDDQDVEGHGIRGL